jgi:hypothetical protein
MVFTNLLIFHLKPNLYIIFTSVLRILYCILGIRGYYLIEGPVSCSDGGIKPKRDRK